MSHKQPGYDLRRCSLDVVRQLCSEHHGYRSCGKVSVYSFAVYEDGRAVAAFHWQPPPPGLARSLAPKAPGGVLALSRMVALPRSERRLNHVSKPLRRQMRVLIDRGRWPVLVTFSDESMGHTGHVYMCSGWQKTVRTRRLAAVDEDGRRVSTYSNGASVRRERTYTTYLQRWEHWACNRKAVENHMTSAGWRLIPVPGKRWRSGSQAMRWVRDPLLEWADANE